MKKSILALMLVLLACVSLLCFASCDETHTHSYTHTVVEPTCTNGGYTLHECSCGESYTDTPTNAIGHTYGDLVPAKSATCNDEGYVAHYHCDACNAYFDEYQAKTTWNALVIAKTAHAYGNLVFEKPATCEEDGYEEHYHCGNADCGKYFTSFYEETTWEDLVIASSHNYGTLVHNPATCTTDGYKDYYQCADCKVYFDTDKNETTLTALAESAKGHNYGTLVHNPATCATEGYKDYYQCADCKVYFDTDKDETTLTALVESAKGHNYGTLVHSPATCATEGYKDYYQCSNCQTYFDTDKNETTLTALVESAKGHNYGTLVHNPATCTTDGYKDYYQCSNCQAYFDADKNETTLTALAENAKGHNYEDTVITATCIAAGYTNHVCPCGDSYKDTPTAKLDHICNDLDICSLCNNKIFELTYTLSTDESYYVVEGIKHGKTATTFEIPAEYEGKTVKEIASSAFEGNTKLTSVTIPTSITTIGEKAFYNCVNLDITIAGQQLNDKVQVCYKYNADSKLSYIGNYAFSNTAITTVAFPKSITAINEGVFDGCTKLETVYFHGGLNEISAYAFRNTGVTELPEIRLMESIGESAFEGCNKLTKISLYSLTTISKRAFAGSAITGELTIHNGIKSIKEEAFMDCKNITKLTVASDGNNNVRKTIGIKAFFGCTSLKEVEIKGLTYVSSSIGQAAFGRCTSLTTITLPFVGASTTKSNNREEKNNFGYIFGEANDVGTTNLEGLTAVTQFYKEDKTGTTTFYIPSSLKHVVISRDKAMWHGSFSNCTMLESITIRNGTINSYAFDGCTNLKTLDIQASVTNSIVIKEHAFEGLSNLKELYIDGISKNSDIPVTNLLGGLTKLEKLKIPVAKATNFCNYFNNDDSVTDGSGVPKSLKSVTVCDSRNEIVSLPQHFFKGCTSITDATIGEGIAQVRPRIFEGCTSLKKIVIFDGVTYIAPAALQGCSALESLTIPFVGTDLDTKADKRKPCFGEIFGDIEYDGSYAAKKPSAYYSTAYPNYYLPSTLTSVTITGGAVESYAFHYSTSITTLGFKNLTLAINAFSHCENLKNLYLYGNNKLISNSIIFYESSKPKNLYVESLETWLTTPFAYLFKSSKDCHIYVDGELLKGTVVIPGSVTEVGSDTFSGNLDITGVIFEEGVKKIGDRVFENCPNLTSITLPSTLESIGQSAFENCSKLVNVTCPAEIIERGLIPATVTHLTITSGVVSNLNNLPALVSLTLEDGVTEIGANVCTQGCGELQTLNIGKGLTTWTENAFSSCLKLQTITVSAGNENFIVIDNALCSIDGKTKYLSVT